MVRGNTCKKEECGGNCFCSVSPADPRKASAKKSFVSLMGQEIESLALLRLYPRCWPLT